MEVNMPDLLRALELLNGTHNKLLTTVRVRTFSSANPAPPNGVIVPANPHRLALWFIPQNLEANSLTSAAAYVQVKPVDPSGVERLIMTIAAFWADNTLPTDNRTFQYLIPTNYFHVLTHGDIVQMEWRNHASGFSSSTNWNAIELVQTIPCPCKEDKK